MLSNQINTQAAGNGRVNEVQQGLAVGNPTIKSGNYVYTGLVNVNFPSSASFSFGPASSSKQIASGSC